MKKLILFSLLISIASSCLAQHKFEWLTGTWKLKDKNVYEVWIKSKVNDDLIGRSFRINNSDTVVLEKITLTFKNNSYYYIPDVPQNAKPVDFKITTFDNSGFVAENPQHDFPKLIRYRLRSNDNLEAAIEGNGKVIPYSFEKVK
jgi:hypothetical protein